MSTVTASVDARPERSRRFGFAALVRGGFAVWVVVIALVVALSIVKGGAFWTPSNLSTVLTATVVLGLVALGQHLVILTGGIDLSVGSTATLSALLTAVLIDAYPIRVLPVLLGMLVLGALVGLFNGAFVAFAKLPAFIVTLASFYIVQGIALTVSSVPAGKVTSDLKNFALGSLGPIPYSFVVVVIAVAVVGYLLARTRWGKHVYAVGGDLKAARAVGIKADRVLVWVYVASGILAALAGIMLAARSSIGSPTAGQGLELSAITVVVIGGTSLLGGRGSLFGTLGGVLLLALVASSITLLQMPSTLTDLIRGAVIVIAATLFVVKAKR
ncbi:ABC transporter permease [Cnuibacter sp. UC19_7]|uniref:ABC transporter permease n=1 Tax=Cnuibacter sp. UC19_7 TaxID=3350166 RepID=UPI0036728629